MKELGFDACICAQEHSCVKSFWTKLAPDVLVVLDCNYETIKQRRKVEWGEKRIKVQKERLQNALENCDLYLKTDNLTLEETVAVITEYVAKKFNS